MKTFETTAAKFDDTGLVAPTNLSGACKWIMGFIKKLSLRKPESWEQGYSAYCDDETINPFSSGSDEHRLWIAGREAAVRDREW